MLINIYSSSVFKISAVWLVFVIFLHIISPTDIGWNIKGFGFVFFVLLFSPVFLLKGRSQKFLQPSVKPFDHKIIVLGIFVQWVCAQYAIAFYTGSSIPEVVVGSFKGINLYQSYQDFFGEAGIRNTSFVNRLPAIIALAYVKFLFVLSMSFFFQQRYMKFSKTILVLCVLPYLFIGLARGTFFEIFEIFVAFVFFTLSVGYFQSMNSLRRSVLAVASVLLVFMLPALFILNTIRRYEDASLYFSKACNLNFCFEPYGLNFYFEYALYVMSIYFSMGMFFMSHFLKMVLEGGLAHSLIPLYFNFIKGNERGVRDVICDFHVCQFVWVPDVVIIISYFGIFSTVIVFLLFFGSIRLEQNVLSRFNAFSLPLLYFVIVFLLSIPVGNFFTVSSSTILCSAAFFALWLISKKQRLSRV
ncbi:hypothetical protein KG088_10510 [Halomonas sp. TRM85114]|uniref:hypothetical protein n=1 Tax=Halomonas jincaotanensis TaxID=2810616 RepID=UPI001BD494EA|nr:hypothetical protein [Halomonas jincaotanensis]MBS9404062.1 hypothetical protein [Halomonas jincaotanensis]